MFASSKTVVIGITILVSIVVVLYVLPKFGFALEKQPEAAKAV
jgi:hypothetical protein